MQIQTIKSKRSIKAIIISFSILFILYLSVSIYFSNHFYFGSIINDVDASAKTVKVGGGDFGWKVQREGEVGDLIATIKNGKTIAKEPRYIFLLFVIKTDLIRY